MAPPPAAKKQKTAEPVTELPPAPTVPIVTYSYQYTAIFQCLFYVYIYILKFVCIYIYHRENAGTPTMVP